MSKIFAVAAIAFLSMMPATLRAAELPKESVEKVSRYVHQHMEGAMLPDGSLIDKEDAAALKYPLIPYQDREKIILVGNMSGFAEWCGLDWKKKSFEPWMNSLRRDHRDWSGEQFAYAALLHGASFQGAINSRKAAKCPDDLRDKISKNMIGNK